MGNGLGEGVGCNLWCSEEAEWVSWACGEEVSLLVQLVGGIFSTFPTCLFHAVNAMYEFRHYGFQEVHHPTRGTIEPKTIIQIGLVTFSPNALDYSSWQSVP